MRGLGGTLLETEFLAGAGRRTDLEKDLLHLRLATKHSLGTLQCLPGTVDLQREIVGAIPIAQWQPAHDHAPDRVCRLLTGVLRGVLSEVDA
jgi:hypothetical protein